MQRLQRGRHVVIRPLRIFSGRLQLVDRIGVAGRRDVAVPEGADHEGVVLAGAVPEVEHHLGVVLGERQLDDVDVAAGQLLPDRAELVQRAADAALRPGAVHGDGGGDALEGLQIRPELGAELLARGGDDGVVIGLAEIQEDGPVVLPLDLLGDGLAGKQCRQAGRREKRSSFAYASPPVEAITLVCRHSCKPIMRSLIATSKPHWQEFQTSHQWPPLKRA